MIDFNNDDVCFYFEFFETTHIGSRKRIVELIPTLVAVALFDDEINEIISHNIFRLTFFKSFSNGNKYGLFPFKQRHYHQIKMRVE